MRGRALVYRVAVLTRTRCGAVCACVCVLFDPERRRGSIFPPGAAVFACAGAVEQVRRYCFPTIHAVLRYTVANRTSMLILRSAWEASDGDLNLDESDQRGLKVSIVLVSPIGRPLNSSALEFLRCG